MDNKLETYLSDIEKKLGSEEHVPYNVDDKLGWHLEKIESLIGGGSGGGNVDDVLVNGESVLNNKVANIDLKTINGNSVSGEGDISITTYTPFPSSWLDQSVNTTAKLCAAITSDSTAITGMSFLGEIPNNKISDLPFSGNAEIRAEVLPANGGSGKVIHLTLTSGNVAPYHWEYTYWGGSSPKGWIGFQTELKSGTNIKTVNNTSLLGSGNVAIADHSASEIGAPEYDSTQTYALGDIVSYEDRLYKANTAINVAEEWTAVHWTEGTLVEFILGQLDASY